MIHFTKIRSHSGAPPRRLVCGLVAIVCSTGCPPSRLDFATDTVVELDGSVTRFTRYEATGSTREELRTRYVLPEGGRWVRSTRMRYDASDEEEYVENLDMYLVAKRYARSESIPTDHLRCGETPGRNVENVVDVSVRDYFFFRVFEYRETFRDVEGHKRLLEAAQRVYPVWVDRLAAVMEKRLEDVTKAKAAQSIQSITRPWLDRFLSDTPIKYELLAEALNGAKVAFAKALIGEIPPPPGKKRDAWRASIEAAIEESFQEFDEAEIVRVGLDEEDLAGILYDVYPMLSGNGYSIRQTLLMPGTVLDTNASSRIRRSLEWEFEPDELVVLQEHVSKARSFVLFPLRTAGAVISLLVAALWARWRRSIPS